MYPVLARALILLGATTAQSDRDPSQAPLPPTTEVPAPVARERSLESLFEGAMVGAEDGLDFAETPGYRHLLDSLSRYGEEELRAKAGRQLDVALALADPDGWRGEIVRVRALIAGQMAVRFARPLGEHVDSFRAFLTEADGSEGVVVDFLEPPPPLEMQADVVDVEGVFFRTVRYENKKGVLVEAPYLIARGLRRLNTDTLPRQTAFDELAKIVIGLAVAFLVVRILLTMRKKRPYPATALASRAFRERARVALRPDPPAPRL